MPIAGTFAAGVAAQSAVYPGSGETPQQQMQDVAERRHWAVQQKYDSTNPPAGGRFGRRQRCFYLFVSLVALIVGDPLCPGVGPGAHRESALIQVFVLIAAVAAVGRTTMPFVIALLLAIPALRVPGGGDDGRGSTPAARAVIANAAYIAFYVTAIVYLLGYVFSADVMTGDKLFGAAAGYLMLGLALGVRIQPWCSASSPARSASLLVEPPRASTTCSS